MKRFFNWGDGLAGKHRGSFSERRSLDIWVEQQAAVVVSKFREHPIQDADFYLKAKWKSTVTAPVLPCSCWEADQCGCYDWNLFLLLNALILLERFQWGNCFKVFMSVIVNVLFECRSVLNVIHGFTVDRFFVFL